MSKKTSTNDTRAQNPLRDLCASAVTKTQLTMRRSRFFLPLLMFCSMVVPARADVSMPMIFGDHMVLQAGIKLPFWGKASPGETVSVSLGNSHAQATAGADGKWKLQLDPQIASDTPTTVTVQGHNTITFADVLIGDVWLDSGQSNMQMGMRNTVNSRDEIAKGDHPLIHMFTVPWVNSFAVQEEMAQPKGANDMTSRWRVCSPEVLAKDGWNGFSAVAYFFGREIQEKTGHPLGLINAAFLAQPAESFISLDVLKSKPEFDVYVKRFEKIRAQALIDQQNYPAAKAAFDKEQADWDAKYGADFRKQMSDWFAASDRAKSEHQAPPPAPNPPAPRPKAPPDGSPPLHTPTTVYNDMIHPLIPYAIRGAIWYQGESNTSYPSDYDKLLTTLITEWRGEWQEGDFPFLIVQLPNQGNPMKLPVERGSGWASLREKQFNILKLPNTGMAVTMDLGGGDSTHPADLHPLDKQDVGHRLALVARRMVYGENVESWGPLYASMAVEGSAIRVKFTHAQGLHLGPRPPLVDPSQSVPPEIPYFAICGADQKWVKALAKIDGETIIVSSESVQAPVAVRYAWGAGPLCHLFNADGLPMSPFRSDSGDESAFLPKPK